jgi:hypothetical protein
VYGVQAVDLTALQQEGQRFAHLEDEDQCHSALLAKTTAIEELHSTRYVGGKPGY